METSLATGDKQSQLAIQSSHLSMGQLTEQ